MRNTEENGWEHSYWLYNTDNWLGDCEKLIHDKKLFSRSAVMNKQFSEIVEFYKNNHISTLDSETKNLVNSLSNQLIMQNSGEKLLYDILVIIPYYYKENNEKNIVEILENNFNSIEKDVLVVFYVNGNESDLNKELKNDVYKAFKTLQQKILGKSFFGVVAKNIYNKKPNYSDFRADILDAVILATDSDNFSGSPILISMDADIKNTQEGYLNSLLENFKSSISIVISQRRWTFGFEDGIFVRMNEVLFLLGEENTKNFSKSTFGTPITNGWSTAYKLSDVLKVRGFPRGLNLGEDVILGHKISWFYGEREKNMDIVKFSGKKIWSDGKRGKEALKKGYIIPDQWDHKMTYLSESHEENYLLNSYEHILQKIVKKEFISDDELKSIEDYINRYCEHFNCETGENYRGKSLSDRFARWWNIFLGKGYIFALSNHGYVKLEKSF